MTSTQLCIPSLEISQPISKNSAESNFKKLPQLSNYNDVPLYPRKLGTFISLYAGAGGMDIGFALAGFSPTWISELDADASLTHNQAFEQLAHERPHLANKAFTLHTGDILQLSDLDLPAPGSADLVIGGPPCQGFSVAGKMNPNDERSKHVFHFMDIVERVQPKAFVLENVKALYQNSRWASIREALLKRAQELGFASDLMLLNAAHFGVPQARERMFLIGIRRSLGFPQMPKATTKNCPPTVREALSQLPSYGNPGNDSFCRAKITLAKSPVLRKSPFTGMLFNGAGRPLNLEAPSLTLSASMGGNATPIIDQYTLDNPQAAPWVAGYYSKLITEEVTPARISVPSHLRRLTVEEAAALQTFPIGMKWHGPQSAQFRQIGNAVPPRLSLAVAEAVKNSLCLTSNSNL